MTFLEKLDLMMNARGLNKRQLSILSGVPYTTIDGYYKRGYENAKIANVRRIAKALGVSLNFLLEEEQDQTESPGTAEAIPGDQDESVIMNFVGELSEDQQELLIVLLQKMIEQNQRKLSSHPEEADAPGKE